MPTYTLVDSWDGTSTIGNRVYENHDSKLTGDEVIALVEELANLDGFGTSDGFSAAKPKGIPAKIWDLAQAMQKPKVEILVEKGIHQRWTKPHIRIKLSRGAASYHVELSAEASGRGRFNWTTVGVTFVTKQAHLMQTWPSVYVQSTPGTPGRSRRGSISLGTAPPVAAAAAPAQGS